MTSALREILLRIEAWPASRQQDAVELLKSLEDQDLSDLSLSDAQAAEVQRRRGSVDRATLSSDDVFGRYRSPKA
jgi:uncharacterized protein YjiS (DUF1127 family)